MIISTGKAIIPGLIDQDWDLLSSFLYILQIDDRWMLMSPLDESILHKETERLLFVVYGFGTDTNIFEAQVV